MDNQDTQPEQEAGTGSRQWPPLLEKCRPFFETWKRAVLAPIDFFDNLPADLDLVQPSIFVAVIAGINALFVFLILVPHPMQAAISAVQTFLGFMVGSYIWAGITMGLSKALGAEVDFKRVYNVCAYSCGANVLLWLPAVNIFTGLYSILAFKIGLEQALALPKARAGSIIFLEIVIWLVIGAAAFFASMNALLHGGASGAG